MDAQTALALRLPLDTWRLVAQYINDLRALSICSKELLDACCKVAKVRVLDRFRLASDPKTQDKGVIDISKAITFVHALYLPYPKSAAVPCICVSLAGGIRAHMHFVLDGTVSELKTVMQRTQSKASTYIFAVVSEHAIEATFSLEDAYRGALLRRCGLFAFVTDETSNVMKRIEVRWRGVFNGRLKLFGIPLIIYVPRVVDRRFVHEEVYKRVLPFLRNPTSVASPPYTLTAYNINASGVVNEVAFTADYMLLDSQMHAVGEQFCLFLDFGMYARDSVCFELFGDTNQTGLPSRSVKLVSNLLERDCGLRVL